jgi:hypothetical protein
MVHGPALLKLMRQHTDLERPQGLPQFVGTTFKIQHDWVEEALDDVLETVGRVVNFTNPWRGLTFFYSVLILSTNTHFVTEVEVELPDQVITFYLSYRGLALCCFTCGSTFHESNRCDIGNEDSNIQDNKGPDQIIPDPAAPAPACSQSTQNLEEKATRATPRPASPQRFSPEPHGGPNTPIICTEYSDHSPMQSPISSLRQSMPDLSHIEQYIPIVTDSDHLVDSEPTSPTYDSDLHSSPKAVPNSQIHITPSFITKSLADFRAYAPLKMCNIYR